MSPPVRPPIPLTMAGGRPQPGNRMGREGSPSPWDAPAALAAVAAVAVENAPRVFDFTFDSAVRPGTLAPPTTPAASEDGGPVASASAAAVAVAAVAAVGPSAPGRRRLVAPPAAGLGGGGGASAPRWLPASPVPGTGGLWGQAYLVGQGNLHWETSPRMETW